MSVTTWKHLTGVKMVLSCSPEEPWCRSRQQHVQTKGQVTVRECLRCKCKSKILLQMVSSVLSSLVATACTAASHAFRLCPMEVNFTGTSSRKPFRLDLSKGTTVPVRTYHSASLCVLDRNGPHQITKHKRCMHFEDSPFPKIPQILRQERPINRLKGAAKDIHVL